MATAAENRARAEAAARQAEAAAAAAAATSQGQPGPAGIVAPALAPVAAVPGALSVEARGAALAQTLGGLVTFMATKRRRDRAFLLSNLRRRAAAQAETAGSVVGIVDGELQREEEFARRSAERMARDVPTVLAIPDPSTRSAHMTKLLSREQRYAEQRTQMMTARAVAAHERARLRVVSRQGVFWRLSPRVEHCTICLALGDRFWPWVALDASRYLPPVHGNCACRLYSYVEAVRQGWMRPGDIPDARAAISMARGVAITEARADELLAAEDELREALVGAGLLAAE